MTSLPAPTAGTELSCLPIHTYIGHQVGLFSVWVSYDDVMCEGNLNTQSHMYYAKVPWMHRVTCIMRKYLECIESHVLCESILNAHMDYAKVPWMHRVTCIMRKYLECIESHVLCKSTLNAHMDYAKVPWIHRVTCIMRKYLECIESHVLCKSALNA